MSKGQSSRQQDGLLYCQWDGEQDAWAGDGYVRVSQLSNQSSVRIESPPLAPANLAS